VQVVLAHFCPLGQLVQVACFAFAFLTGTLPLAITVVAAKAIASMLNITFFILNIFILLNNLFEHEGSGLHNYLTGLWRLPVVGMISGNIAIGIWCNWFR
jgi:hypothetical protein